MIRLFVVTAKKDGVTYHFGPFGASPFADELGREGEAFVAKLPDLGYELDEVPTLNSPASVNEFEDFRKPRP